MDTTEEGCLQGSGEKSAEALSSIDCAEKPVAEDTAVTATMEHTSFCQSKDITTELRMTDVLVGRGAAINSHAGNIAFRQIIRLHKPAYQQTTTNPPKHVIAQHVIRDIQQSNGRFLKRIPDEKRGRPSPPSWRILGYDHADVLEKVKQALREKEKSTDTPNSGDGSMTADTSSGLSHSPNLYPTNQGVPADPRQWTSSLAQQVHELSSRSPTQTVPVLLPNSSSGASVVAPFVNASSPWLNDAVSQQARGVPYSPVAVAASTSPRLHGHTDVSSRLVTALARYAVQQQVEAEFTRLQERQQDINNRLQLFRLAVDHGAPNNVDARLSLLLPQASASRVPTQPPIPVSLAAAAATPAPSSLETRLWLGDRYHQNPLLAYPQYSGRPATAPALASLVHPTSGPPPPTPRQASLPPLSIADAMHMLSASSSSLPLAPAALALYPNANALDPIQGIIARRRESLSRLIEIGNLTAIQPTTTSWPRLGDSSSTIHPNYSGLAATGQATVMAPTALPRQRHEYHRHSTGIVARERRPPTLSDLYPEQISNDDLSRWDYLDPNKRRRTR